MKKALIALVSLVLFLTVFPTTISASAAADSSYKPRLTAPEHSNPYYNREQNRYAQTGYGMPNCVAYAYGRVYEMNGKAPLITRGNAGEWWFINKANHYYEYGDTPKLGAVVVWSNHVAVVEEMDENGSITISESHYGGTYFDTKTVTDYTYHYGQTFYGFIYTYEEPEAEEPKSYMAEETVPLPSDEPDFQIVHLESTEANDKIVQNDKMLLLATA